MFLLVQTTPNSLRLHTAAGADADPGVAGGEQPVQPLPPLRRRHRGRRRATGAAVTWRRVPQDRPAPVNHRRERRASLHVGGVRSAGVWVRHRRPAFTLMLVPDGTSAPRAVRAGLARLVAVLAALTLVALLQGALCGNATAMATPCTPVLVSDAEHSSGSTPVHSAPQPAADTTGDCVSLLLSGNHLPAPTQPAAWAAPADTTGSPNDLGGVVGLCLAMLAVLFLLVWLLRPGAVTAPPPPTTPTRFAHRTRTGAPRLSQLCVLRT